MPNTPGIAKPARLRRQKMRRKLWKEICDCLSAHSRWGMSFMSFIPSLRGGCRFVALSVLSITVLESGWGVGS
jgi:hypothetical protein